MRFVGSVWKVRNKEVGYSSSLWVFKRGYDYLGRIEV